MSSEEAAAPIFAAEHAVDEVNDTPNMATSPARQLSSPFEEPQPASAHENETKPQTIATPEDPASLTKRPPKMRLKLSMRKLPTLANRKLTGTTPRPDPNNSDEEDEVKATIVDSDDAAEDQATAAVLGGETSSQTDPGAAAVPSKPKRRTVNNPSRQIRLPPIASPGLYMAPPSLVPKEKIAKNGFIAPADVFDYNMELTGYTRENRTKRPHRGSSVTRTIGDMFDSNVALSLRFPPLIPPANERQQVDDHKDDMEVDGETKLFDLRQRLINSLTRKNGREMMATSEASSSRKRHKPLRISDMVPVSLSITYPEDFVNNQIKYVEDVNRREQAIINYQDALFLAQSAVSDDGSDDNNNDTLKDARLPAVPPIPNPPTPPHLKDLSGLETKLYQDHGNTAICLPKGKDDFVAHLDPNCFHVVSGRYFGLSSNFIADPNFVGPNAPGIAGMNASGGSGLATSSSGGGISGAMALTLSTTYNGTTAGSAAAFRGASTAPTSVNPSQNGKASPLSSTDDTTGASTAMLRNELTVSKLEPAGEVKDIGPRPTAFYADLKSIFDEEGPMAHSMKECIIKAAVHASRSGHHGVSWLGADGETYPDISKAFALHAGVKPCLRCKNNKQGAYHCRLRRKHKDLDYDGGDSPTVLSPLLLAPMESLRLPALTT